MSSLPGWLGVADAAALADVEDRFEAELRPLLGDALRLASGMLLDSSAAEDAVQEACLRAWRRRANRRTGTDLRPWFLAIVANQCRETTRSSWTRVLRFAEVPRTRDTRENDPTDALDLTRELWRLRPRHRLALVLRYYLDLPYEDVAAVMGCSIHAAKALVRRGGTDLARRLGQGYGRR